MKNCELEDTKIGGSPGAEAIKPQTSNILNADVLAAIDPETLVVRKVNEGLFKGPKKARR
ncbi:hypothetical protein BDM02DRAFT_3116776, partial [Thelephora ganbajun]